MMPLYDNLPEPAPLKKGNLRIVPLGGLGEVGRNMNVLEFGDKLLVVDCGVLFPEESQPGVDLILPDFSWIEDRLDDIFMLSKKGTAKRLVPSIASSLRLPTRFQTHLLFSFAPPPVKS